MSATPEREQAEALLLEAKCFVIGARSQELPGILAAADLIDALAAAVSRLEADLRKAEANELRLVERAEKAERERDELHDWQTEAVPELYKLNAEMRAAVERERELTRLLAAARGFVDWIASWAGGDLNGLTWNYVIAEAIRTREALAGGVSAAPDEDEQAYCAECGRAGAPETLPEAYDEECPSGAPCRGVSAAGRPPEQDLGGGTAAVAEALREALEALRADYSLNVFELRQRPNHPFWDGRISAFEDATQDLAGVLANALTTETAE